jgi:hypothetical protein
VLLLTAAGFIAACDTSDVVANVGERSITRVDVRFRQRVMRVRSGREVPAHLALFGLIREALTAEVARRHGVVVTTSMLADEADRVQTETRDPQTLRRIRAVFGPNETAYRRLVLEPAVVNQLLHARFSLSHSIQAEPLARAKAALGAVQTGARSMPEAAEELDGTHHTLEVVDGRIRRHCEGRPEGPTLLTSHDVEWPDPDRELMERVVQHLEPGQIHPQVVEDRWTFRVVRLRSRRGDDAALETVVIPKLRFDEWFRSCSQTIPLVVTDRELREAIVKKIDVPFITERLTRLR